MLNYSDFAFSNSNTVELRKGSVTDEMLFRSLKAGNDLALSMLYKRYVNRLYDYAMHLCGNHHLAMDCLQGIFCELWNKRDESTGIQLVKPFLFKSLRKSVIYQVKANRSNSTIRGRKEFGFLSSIKLALKKTSGLDDFFRSLSSSQHEVIYLKFCHGLTHSDIVEITVLQLDDVHNLVSRTIHLLRMKLTKNA